MLSIDITDKQLKLVRGSLSGSKIRVTDVETRDVPEGSIVNGYITNIPLVAGEMTDMFESKKISEKEIVVCINSSAILYKEMEVPKPKSLKNTAAIEAMIIAQMGIANDYNISYSIVGEGVDIDKRPIIKLMATACPQRMVDGYTGLFNQLGMKLKQINISNNCITRLILNSPKLKEAMPFLCIQVDVDFININLYENGQVALSRYVKIDPSDYENNPDYINIAVFDNLFRMIQFIGQRPGAKPLKQIMFYGIIKDFVALSNAILSFNLPAHVLAMPNNIVKFCELDFSRYANAIGAFYKADPLYEHINLLQSKAVKSKKGASMFLPQILLVAAVSAGAVFGLRWWFLNINNNLISERMAIEAQLADQQWEVRRTRMNEKRTVLTKFESYKYSVMAAKNFFDYSPVYLPQIREKLHEAVESVLPWEDTYVYFYPWERVYNDKASYTQPDNRGSTGTMFVYFENFTTTDYDISLSFYTNSMDFPADFAQALEEQGFFEAVVYRGHTKTLTKDFDPMMVARMYDFNRNTIPLVWVEPVNRDEMNRENTQRNNPNSPRYEWRVLNDFEDGSVLYVTMTIKLKSGHAYESGSAYVYNPEAPVIGQNINGRTAVEVE
ncbi:MAG: competence protein ComA [Oscillospiraceae bacterium]|nr:competence protein ComA [Oscillospiraceae bacterium]